MFEVLKNFFDGAAVAAIAATIFEIVPAISAVVALLYLCIRTYETTTVQALLKKLRKS